MDTFYLKYNTQIPRGFFFVFREYALFNLKKTKSYKINIHFLYVKNQVGFNVYA